MYNDHFMHSVLGNSCWNNPWSETVGGATKEHVDGLRNATVSANYTDLLIIPMQITLKAMLASETRQIGMGWIEALKNHSQARFIGIKFKCIGRSCQGVVAFSKVKQKWPNFRIKQHNAALFMV